MRKNNKPEKDLDLSYIKVDVQKYGHLTMEHIKNVHRMVKYDFHDALIRYDIDKMICMNHELMKAEDVLYGLLDNEHEDIVIKRCVKKYMNFIRTVRETFSAILNTQEIIAHFSTKLSPIQIRILIVLNETPEMTTKELIDSIGKSATTIRKEIESLEASCSIPVIQKFTMKGERYKGVTMNHYQITSYGKHLINYIEDISYNERINSLNENRNDVLLVFKEQRHEIDKINSDK